MTYTRSAFLGTYAPERIPSLKKLLHLGAAAAEIDIYLHENKRIYSGMRSGFFRDHHYERSEVDLTVDVWNDNAPRVDDYVSFFVPLVARGSIHPLESYRSHLRKS